ncbi:PREDICTED: uncharacterized protein LOC107192636, partial [Dufourea novaeangliae]|uniref:uncharacterized protein LOC107192636 n=1 Tax=Dufourea novaeangliae TaxID=178035 RepID=UPI0007679574
MAEKEKAVEKEDDPQETNAVSLRISKFWPDRPALWFALLEGQFALRGITQDATCYGHVLEQLDAKTAAEVEDILINPPENGKFEKLKQELIARFSHSKEKRIRKLLEHEEIGDRIPSQFLRHLKTLAEADVPEDLLKTIWKNRLPTSVQTVLATQDDATLDKMATLADKVSEISPPGRGGTVAECTDMDRLVKQIAALVTENLRREYRPPGRSRSRGRNLPRGRSSSRKRDEQRG